MQQTQEETFSTDVCHKREGYLINEILPRFSTWFKRNVQLNYSCKRYIKFEVDVFSTLGLAKGQYEGMQVNVVSLMLYAKYSYFVNCLFIYMGNIWN